MHRVHCLYQLSFDGAGGNAFDQCTLHEEVERQEWDGHHCRHGHHVMEFRVFLGKALLKELKRHNQTVPSPFMSNTKTATIPVKFSERQHPHEK